MNKEKILDNLAAIFVIIFWISGNVGIMRIIDYFLPNLIGLLSLLIPCLSGCVLYYAIELPRQKLQKELELSNFELTRLEQSVEDAVWQNSVAPLFSHCDPAYLKYAQNSSPFWNPEKNPQ